MPTIMLPATEKLSTQAFCFFSARYTNPAMTRALTAATAMGVQSPVKVKRPLPETKPPI